MTTALVLAPQRIPDKKQGNRQERATGVPDYHRVTRDELDLAIGRYRPPRPGTRDQRVLLARFLWVTGCRISEALSVRCQDFDFGARCVRLATLKRRRRHFRALPLPNAFCGQLAQWIAFARPGPDDRIWPWSRSWATEIVTAVLVGGVDRRRAHPHALRHGHSFHAVAHQVPLPALQMQLGHLHLSTTAIYARATAADLRASYDQVPW